MDLHPLQSYYHPHQICDLEMSPAEWQEQGCSWLAGGTWLFSQPQPQIRTLVDLDGLNWSEIQIHETGLTLGATCPLNRLLDYPWPSPWRAMLALQAAIRSLASFKVTEVATVGGNLCLALTVGSLAPVMGVLQATYEIWDLTGGVRELPASDFQIGPQSTRLRPGEVLRRIHIPQNRLIAAACFERASLAAIEPALAIVVGLREKQTLSLGINAALPTPQILTFSSLPHPAEVEAQLATLKDWIGDYRCQADYRRHLTGVLCHRCLTQLTSQIEPD